MQTDLLRAFAFVVVTACGGRIEEMRAEPNMSREAEAASGAPDAMPREATASEATAHQATASNATACDAGTLDGDDAGLPDGDVGDCAGGYCVPADGTLSECGPGFRPRLYYVCNLSDVCCLPE